MSLNITTSRKYTYIDGISLEQPQDISEPSLSTEQSIAEISWSKRITESLSSSASFFARLPEEIILHIFSFTDLKTIERIAQVCLHWYVLSKDPSLWKSFLQRYFSVSPISDSILSIEKQFKFIFQTVIYEKTLFNYNIKKYKTLVQMIRGPSGNNGLLSEAHQKYAFSQTDDQMIYYHDLFLYYSDILVSAVGDSYDGSDASMGSSAQLRQLPLEAAKCDQRYTNQKSFETKIEEELKKKNSYSSNNV